MKPKICKFEGCDQEAINFPNSTIKQKFCKDHAISQAISKVRLNSIKTAKKELREKKESIRTKNWYEKKLESEVNQIVRLIDNDKGCISCKCGWETSTERQFHAGHRKSVKSNPTIRFNVFNIYKQCSICNNWESANEREYDKGIIKYYGQEMLDDIEQLPAEFKEIHLSIDELKEAIDKSRILKKEILSGKDFTRKEINDLIGIYK